MLDALFRTNSAVVLPEGESPASVVGEHESLSTIGLVASVLRYNAKHEGKKLLVAGHADRSSTIGFNQPLSEERARAVLALVDGNRDAFAAICKKRNSEVDLTQIFDWANRNPNLRFKCKPTVMDRIPSDTNYDLFRESFNAWVDAAPSGEHRGTKIRAKGRADSFPDIWGAVYDIYESELGKELGELPAGVAALRADLTWVDDNQKFVGYSEHHPIAKDRPNGMRSKEDRRVEVLFFDKGEEPVPATEAKNPKASAVYDGTIYERRRLPADPSLWDEPYTLRLYLHDEHQMLMPDTEYELTVGREIRRNRSDANGHIEEKNIPYERIAILKWCRQSILNPPTTDWKELQRRKKTPTYLFSRDILLEPAAQTSADKAEMMLHNLGYLDEDFGMNWAAFQVEYGLPKAPYYDATTYERLREVHGDGLEPQKATGGTTGDGDPEVIEEDGPYASLFEIVLEDADGKGVTGELWEVRDKAGNVLAFGRLDTDGRATVLGIDSPDAAVCFPDRDESAWDATSGAIP
jgi:hypothetical protein